MFNNTVATAGSNESVANVTASTAPACRHTLIYYPHISPNSTELSVSQINMLYIFPCMFAIGVSGNIMNLLVLSSRKMRSQTNLVLAAMAAADTAFFVVWLPDKIVGYAWVRESYEYFVFWIHASIFFMTFGNLFSTASIWLTVAATVERFVAVRYPLRAKRYLLQSRILLTVVCIYACSLLLNLYHLLGPYRSQDVELCSPIDYGGTNMTSTFRLLFRKELRDEDTLEGRYFRGSMIASTFLVVIVPLLLVITLNSFLITSLILTQRVQNQLTNGRTNEETKATRMVVFMTCSFTILNLPSAVVYIVDWYYNHNVPLRPVFTTIIVPVSNIMVCLGKTINFLIYYSASQKFRRYFLRLCGCGRFARASKDHHRYQHRFRNRRFSSCPQESWTSRHGQLSPGEKLRHRSMGFIFWRSPSLGSDAFTGSFSRLTTSTMVTGLHRANNSIRSERGNAHFGVRSSVTSRKLSGRKRDYSCQQAIVTAGEKLALGCPRSISLAQATPTHRNKKPVKAPDAPANELLVPEQKASWDRKKSDRHFTLNNNEQNCESDKNISTNEKNVEVLKKREGSIKNISGKPKKSGTAALGAGQMLTFDIYDGDDAVDNSCSNGSTYLRQKRAIVKSQQVEPRKITVEVMFTSPKKRSKSVLKNDAKTDF